MLMAATSDTSEIFAPAPVSTERAGGSFVNDRRPNLPAFAAAVIIQSLLLGGLIYNSNIVSHNRQEKERMHVFDVLDPPRQSAPPQEQKPAEVVRQKQPDVVAPPPKVDIPIPREQTIQTATAPRPPVEVEKAQAKPAAPALSVTPVQSGPVNVGNLASKMISAPPPRYPVESRTKRQEGTVILRLILSNDGRVANISVEKSSGFSALDKAALDAVRKWRWSPTIRDGQQVQVTGLVRIPFSIKQ